MIDVENYIKNLGIEFTNIGSELNFICPFCGHNDKKFYANVDTGKWVCHSAKECGQRSNKFSDFVALIEGITESDVESYLNGEAIGNLDSLKEELNSGIKKEELGASIEREGILNTYSESIPVTKSKKAMEYLNTRHLSDADLVTKLNLRYCPDGKYFGRIVFPIFDDGTFSSFDAKTIIGLKPKSLYPKGHFLQSYIWGQISDFVIVVEGVWDALALLICGFPSVCTFGSAPSARQMSAILKRTDNIILYYDPDYAGKKAVDKWTSFYSPAKAIAEDKDPNDKLISLGHEAFKDLITNHVHMKLKNTVEGLKNGLTKI